MNNPLTKPGGVLDTVIQQVKPAVKDVKVQVTGEEQRLEQGKAKKAETASPQNKEQRKKEQEEMLKALYGKSEDGKPSGAQATGGEQGVSNKKLTPQEQQKLLQLQQQLHKETYYDPTFNRPKKPQEEERPAEKIEREEKMEFMKKEEEKEKKQPIAVTNERNKAEMNRGAAG